MFSFARMFQPYKLFPNPNLGLHLGSPSESLLCNSLSLWEQPAGLLLISPARLHSAWLKGQGQGPPELLCLRADLIWHSPSQWDKLHHADSHRPRLSPAKFSWADPGNRKLYWWMELCWLFLIELNSTLGHLSRPLGRSLQMGQLRPHFVSSASFTGWHLPHLPAPWGTNAPTWFCLQCCNLFLFQKTIICLTNYTVFTRPIWINKHYVFSLGAESLVKWIRKP